CVRFSSLCSVFHIGGFVFGWIVGLWVADRQVWDVHTARWRWAALWTRRF
ncbi:MAG: hypothetical protein ACI9QL_004937, partial [Candidatus Omnitrophota bacterium]